MNEINGGSFRVSWKEDGVYQETLYLLDEEEIPVLRSCPYASVFQISGCTILICRKGRS